MPLKLSFPLRLWVFAQVPHEDAKAIRRGCIVLLDHTLDCLKSLCVDVRERSARVCVCNTDLLLQGFSVLLDSTEHASTSSTERAISLKPLVLVVWLPLHDHVDFAILHQSASTPFQFFETLIWDIRHSVISMSSRFMIITG